LSFSLGAIICRYVLKRLCLIFIFVLLPPLYSGASDEGLLDERDLTVFATEMTGSADVAGEFAKRHAPTNVLRRDLLSEGYSHVNKLAQDALFPRTDPSLQAKLQLAALDFAIFADARSAQIPYAEFLSRHKAVLEGLINEISETNNLSHPAWLKLVRTAAEIIEKPIFKREFDEALGRVRLVARGLPLEDWVEYANRISWAEIREPEAGKKLLRAHRNERAVQTYLTQPSTPFVVIESSRVKGRKGALVATLLCGMIMSHFGSNLLRQHLILSEIPYFFDRTRNEILLAKRLDARTTAAEALSREKNELEVEKRQITLQLQRSQQEREWLESGAAKNAAEWKNTIDKLNTDLKTEHEVAAAKVSSLERALQLVTRAKVDPAQQQQMENDLVQAKDELESIQLRIKQAKDRAALELGLLETGLERARKTATEEEARLRNDINVLKEDWKNAREIRWRIAQAEERAAQLARENRAREGFLADKEAEIARLRAKLAELESRRDQMPEPSSKLNPSASARKPVFDRLEVNPPQIVSAGKKSYLGVFEKLATTDEQKESLLAANQRSFEFSEFKGRGLEVTVEDYYGERTYRTGNFWIQLTEVTNYQYAEFLRDTGKNQTKLVEILNRNLNEPVVNISWNEAADFVSWVNKKHGTRNSAFTLPTAVEWEIASGSGVTTSDDETTRDYEWNSENAEGKIHPVAQLNPNSLGNFDMLGNASEWVGSSHIAGASERERNSAHRSFRGGSFLTQSTRKQTYRHSDSPDTRYADVGFRLIYRTWKK
jgi:formylglycine-generating enzyme required for sulfatase activity